MPTLYFLPLLGFCNPNRFIGPVKKNLFFLVNNALIGKRKKDEIGFSVVRGGNVVGEHSIKYFNGDERLEINHNTLHLHQMILRHCTLNRHQMRCFFYLKPCFFTK